MTIAIRGAREHNLKNIDVDIPRNRLVVVTGISGSGKSSLAIDTVFAEGLRQYVESLSMFARRYISKTSVPDADGIAGLSPTILVNQRPLGRSPRSTVGTVTELYTLLRLLFSRAGQPRLTAGEFSFNNAAGACAGCGGLGVELAVDEDALVDWSLSLTGGAVRHRTFKVGGRYWNIIAATGYFNMEKPLREFTRDELDLLLYSPPVLYKNDEPGYVQRFTYEGVGGRLLRRQRDDRGLAVRADDAAYLIPAVCTKCHGARLNQRALSVRLQGRSILDYSTVSLETLSSQLRDVTGDVATGIAAGMQHILGALLDLGVGYLTLNRSVDTLSGGESQRIKLSRQLGSALTELIYVLDEPSAGLHARDLEHLADVLDRIRTKPNTVLFVEHDESLIRRAEWVIELGPGAGTFGGRVIATGTPSDICADPESVTGAFLSGRREIPMRTERRTGKGVLSLTQIRLHNLQDISVDVPLGVLVCLTGVSGSGKSSLAEALVKRHPEVIFIDQSAVGTSPRSNPATYVGVFDLIRAEFGAASGRNRSLFSYNAAGACPTCDGLGYEKVDMHFLDDVRLVCDDCKGSRYNEEALGHRYKGANIAEALQMTITQAYDFYDSEQIRSQLRTLVDVGLGYLELGQPLDTLSAGEALRVRLCSYLVRRGNVYVVDEPTRGLHLSDIGLLMVVLQRLVENGNTVIVIEHHLDVIKNADWVIDLGPEGGERGGRIVVAGTPEEVAACEASYTGQYLRSKLRVSADS